MMRLALSISLLLVTSSFAQAEDYRTYVVPEKQFKKFSKAKRVEYVKSVIKVLAQHERSWNGGAKITSLDIFFSQAFADAPEATTVCIIGTRKIAREAKTKICTTQVNDPLRPKPPTLPSCGSVQTKYSCGAFNLHKCVDRLPVSEISQRCFEAAIADEVGLAAITQPQIEEAVKMYYSACNSTGDNHGCFFLAQQLKKLGKVVGTAMCDNFDDDAIMEAGNILIGNGHETETTEVSYMGSNSQIKSLKMGSLQCAKCHGQNFYDLIGRDWGKTPDVHILNHINKYMTDVEKAAELHEQELPEKIKMASDLAAMKQSSQGDGEAAMSGISCVLGRFLDIGIRYPAGISATRSDWKLPVGVGRKSVVSPTAR